MTSELAGATRSIDEYVGILAVDVRHFSQHNDAGQELIVDRLPEILQQVADRTGLDALWGQHRFKAFRGDGYVVGFDRHLICLVVDRFFDALQGELRRRSGEFRAAGVEFRVRTSLHLGPVTSFDALLMDSPPGRVLIETNRMVDAGAVRALLDNSDPDVTFVASVLSSSVMEDVIVAGATTRRPSEFVEAPLGVAAKEYSGRGYLRVPAPSGDLLRYGLLHGQPEVPVEDAPEAARVETVGDQIVNHVGESAHDVVQARDIGGGTHHDVARDKTKSIEVVGHGNVTAGNNVHQTSGDQVFSGTFNTESDANFGPSSGRRIGGGSGPEPR
ncbi:hypothetical protein ACFPM7_22535 [Actinokineospora guangxiensis]|uniref:Class 3 adenylate cyclase n=1 Tax=Actinokineospora guangxiensis TaxID=1490288 RepID=A0ABW0ESV1_9PSEU